MGTEDGVVGRCLCVYPPPAPRISERNKERRLTGKLSNNDENKK